MTDYTVKFNEDGQPIDATGIKGLTGDVETKGDGDKIEVRVTLNAIGDDALYAGSITAHIVLTAPGAPPTGDKIEAAVKGAEWAKAMIEALPEALADVLPKAMQHAAKDASGINHHKIDAIVSMIATLAVATFEGSADKAKDAVARLMAGEVVEEWGPRGLDIPPHLSDEDKAKMLARMNDAIDTFAKAVGN